MKYAGTKRLFIRIMIPLLIAAASLLIWRHSLTQGLPYHDSFAVGKSSEWKALGGTWELAGGTMRSNSDERGAKLLAGSSEWKDYVIEADVMLLDSNGDAGLIARSGNEEEGVDSYIGYYAGLRVRDNSLVLGRADYGWIENTRQVNPTPHAVQPFRWYHLELLVYECHIVASASSGGYITTIAITDKNCIPKGRVGLRSYSSGGVWKNVRVRRATPNDLSILLGTASGDEPVPAQPSTAENPEVHNLHSIVGDRDEPPPVPTENIQPIGDLRLFPFSNTASARIRGVVIFTSPMLFIEDPTGGISVSNANTPPLKMGDEVEVSGQVHPGNFSSSLDRATVQLLWSRPPLPAASVTASQAATGVFDATFIELEGRLRGQHPGPSNTLVLDLDAGSQSFQAIATLGRGGPVRKDLQPGSLLRLRGVCVVDTAYTHNLTPFAVLLRSTEDVTVLAGPPWWNAGHLLASLIGLFILAFLANFLYSRIERSRFRAVMEERERLAHEMHDTLAQSFAGIGFQLEAIRNGIPQSFTVPHQQLDLASALVHHSHDEARRSIATLRAESLQSETVVTALGRCAYRMVEGGTIKIVTTCEGEMRAMPLRITDTLFRIGQEAIANAVAHAHSDTITIDFRQDRNMATLIVSDNGIGFTARGEVQGFGLRGMRKRAAFISALLQIRSSLGEGTHIEVSAPLPPHVTFFSWPRILWKTIMEHRTHVSTV